MERFYSKRDFFHRSAIAVAYVVFLFGGLHGPSLLLAQSLEEEAKREGKVVFYSAMIVSDQKARTDGFEQRYPFVKVESWRAGSDS